MARSRLAARIPRHLVAVFLVPLSLTISLEAQFGPLLSPSQAPQARSQEELDAYLEITTTREARQVVEKVSRFAARFPRSELLGIAYQYQMRAFEELNNFDGTVTAGEKALRANPDNLNTLLTLAPTIANHAGQGPDQLILLAQAEEYAHRALQAIEKTRIPRQIPVDHWELEKKEMQSEAHDVLGVIALRRGQSETAVKEFQMAVHLAPRDRGVEFLRLGIAYASTGAKEKAEMSLRRAAQLGPDPIRRLALNELKRQANRRSRAE